MRETPNTHDSQFVSPAAQTTIAIAMLAGFFAVLVAAANPGIAAAFALGGLGVIGGTRALAFARREGGVCVPGTDVCLHASTA